MDIKTRVVLIIGSILFFIFLLRTVKKAKLNIDVATLWIVFSLAMILLAIFPEVVYFFTSLIGIDAPVNGIYLVIIFIMLVMIFGLYMKISKLEIKINKLTETIAIEKKKNEK